MKSDISIAVYS